MTERKEYWKKIASQWRTPDDGIDVPTILPVSPISDDDRKADNSEIDGILADLGLDDI